MTTSPPKTVDQPLFLAELTACIGKPVTKLVTYGHGKNKKKQTVSKEHSIPWVASSVNLKTRQISTHVYIDYDTGNIQPKEATKLIKLASQGIGEFWSRKIVIAKTAFTVNVDIQNRKSQAIDVKIKVNTDKSYDRSHNSGIIDARFIYNKGIHAGFPGRADKDFKLVSAHEFGHSVLEQFGGRSLSWGHKGSTNPLLQAIKKSTPGYPKTGPIDLMKYYDNNKNNVTFTDLYTRSIAAEIDVKRLIWLGKVTFTG